MSTKLRLMLRRRPTKTGPRWEAWGATDENPQWHCLSTSHDLAQVMYAVKGCSQNDCLSGMKVPTTTWM